MNNKNRSIGLRRWYVNIPITILDIFHGSADRKMDNIQNCDSCDKNIDSFMETPQF
jgi:ribosomal protein L34E